MLIDSFTTQNGDYVVMATGGSTMAGQSFTGNGQPLKTATFMLKKTGTPTGNMVARLYAHSGSFGSTGVATGVALATSQAINANTLTTSYTYVHFTFSTPYTLTSSTRYIIVLDVSSTTSNSSNQIQMGQSTSGGHSGNRVNYDSLFSSWSANSSADIVFYTYGTATGSRYLRATGDWDGQIWAAASGGAAGSAPVPTSADRAYIESNYSVTLTADANCMEVRHSNGTLSIGGYKLTASHQFWSGGTTARTVNLQNGTVIVGVSGSDALFTLSGSNLSFNAGNGTIVLNTSYDDTLNTYNFGTLGKVFNDVIINLGVGTSQSTTLPITGSPTFRSLIIQSKNSAAHTVNFEDNSTITLDKLVLIGSSPSNRLKITEQFDASDSVQFTFSDNATVYGQNVDMWAGRSYPENPNVPLYIGSNSTHASGSTNWLLQDPPKISTLVDPLTTFPEGYPNQPDQPPSTNVNWAYSGTVLPSPSGAGGGGYDLGASSFKEIITTDTHDFVGSELVIELPSAVSSGGSLTWEMLNLYPLITVRGTLTDINTIHTVDMPGGNTLISGASPVFVRYRLDTSGNLSVATSSNGLNWTSDSTIATIPEELLVFMRSTRLRFYSYVSATGLVVGSINVIPVPTNPGAFLPFFTP